MRLCGAEEYLEAACGPGELGAFWRTSGNCTSSIKHRKSSMKLFIEKFLSVGALQVSTRAPSQLGCLQFPMILCTPTNKQKPPQLPLPLFFLQPPRGIDRLCPAFCQPGGHTVSNSRSYRHDNFLLHCCKQTLSNGAETARNATGFNRKGRQLFVPGFSLG